MFPHVNYVYNRYFIKEITMVIKHIRGFLTSTRLGIPDLILFLGNYQTLLALEVKKEYVKIIFSLSRNDIEYTSQGAKV